LTPEEFPAVFAHGWALPKPQPFLDHFLPLLHDDAIFTQPMFGEAHGRAAIERMFRRLFRLFPDLIATPRRSAVDGNVVFIESDCTGTLGAKPIHFPVCDRFTVADDKILARRTYSDPLPILGAVLGRPSSWTQALRSRIG
jgi:limonene-1,2-epoxide hydrolase